MGHGGRQILRHRDEPSPHPQPSPMCRGPRDHPGSPHTHKHLKQRCGRILDTVTDTASGTMQQRGTLNGRISRRLTSLTPHCPCAVSHPPRHAAGPLLPGSHQNTRRGSTATRRPPPAPGTWPRCRCHPSGGGDANPAAAVLQMVVSEGPAACRALAKSKHYCVWTPMCGTGCSPLCVSQELLPPCQAQSQGRHTGTSPAAAAAPVLTACVPVHARDTCSPSHQTLCKH